MWKTRNCVEFNLFFQGDEFVNYLHAEYLPTLQISPQLIDEYCQALKAENKIFKNYVKVSGRNWYFELI
jgi:exportin-T